MAEEPPEPLARPGVLAAYVEIMIAAGEVEAARAASDELAALAHDAAPVLQAMAAHATGCVLLAGGEPSGALGPLRRAATGWRQLGMRFDAARAGVSIGLACRALGDEDAAEVEWRGARVTFERLGAATELARLDRLARPGTAAGRLLTERECEVLRLVAAGRTNREIGAELVISEHTVARHVQNIFTKLGVSSRAAATAHAYEQHLV
jgi:ATP/maltotriose-dependent transcriptional regulator MalT